jgi:hypothetical protein
MTPDHPPPPWPAISLVTQHAYACRELALHAIEYPHNLYRLRVQRAICDTLAALVELGTVATEEDRLKVLVTLMAQEGAVGPVARPHRTTEKTSTPWRTS